MHALRPAAVIVASVFAVPSLAAACPFCGVVAEPLAARRDAAGAVAVAEGAGEARRDDSGLLVEPLRLRQWIRGESGDGVGGEVLARVDSPIRGTAVAFGPRDHGGRWSGIPADESLIVHVATAPRTDEPAVQRLRWFAKRLTHPDPAVADDALAEFAAADFADVQAAADAFDADRLRAWVAEPHGPGKPRGFYALALGLVAAGDPAERAAAVELLRTTIAAEAAADDFRAGFDGLAAGLLVAEGEQGLAMLEAMGLLEPQAGAVVKRQVLAALRFAWESLAETIPRQKITEATARLLASPSTAADAVVDLARYRYWAATDEVAGLWETLGADDPLIRRAVAGYLAASPQPEAAVHLARLRREDRAAVESALEAARSPLAAPQSAPGRP